MHSAPSPFADPVSARLATRRIAAAGFARLPDRGDLAAYPSKQAAISEGASAWHRVELSEEHALAAIIGGHLRITAPSGEELDFRYERHVEHPSGDWTWVGRIDRGGLAQEAIITFGERAVFGSIAQPGKPALKLTMRDGKSWLVETDPAKLALLENSIGPDHADDYLIPSAAANASVVAPTSASVAAAATAANSQVVVDVLVGYSNGFATGLGGASQAVTRLNYLVEVTNQAYVNSQITSRIRMVHAMQVNYPDNSDNGGVLEKMTGTRTTPVDPAFNALRAARDQYGADLVSFVRKYDRTTQDGCGIAWLLGGNQQPITTSSAPNGYSVVSDGRQNDGGTTYFCRDETFAHELGHNMGAQHDRATASSGGTLQYGAYAYSFGYKAGAATGNFYDIMAYGDPGQTSYRVFSNPRITTCGGFACGVAGDADTAQTLNQTHPIIATFRAAVVASAVVRNDFDGDGKSDVYWRNLVSGVNDLWFMNGASLVGVITVHREPDLSWEVAGSGDFNGDGRSDVVWRHSRTGQVYVHLMESGRILPASGYSFSVGDLNWKIVALGDFDGDRKTDLYWRNSVNGTNDIWFMNGVIPRSVVTVYREPNLAWSVAGSGDFNGDGTADIFWRNASSGQNYIHLMSGATVLSASGAAPTVADSAWKPVAFADFGGDGRSDVYWRHATTGECHLWRMAGTVPSEVNLVHVEPDQAWKVVNSGDYNGDGKADIFWRNQRTGQNYIHLLDGSRILPGSGSLYTVSDTNWVVTGT
ncbi:FG-GAP repeat family protein [Lysobacter antibioticus]|nr:FG-GAP repeat family protein [Lysobacter antibioticus]